jgi:hypothetical protein
MQKKDILIRGLPVDLHRDLKILAVLEGTTLQQLVIDVLAAYATRQKATAEPEAQAKA